MVLIGTTRTPDSPAKDGPSETLEVGGLIGISPLATESLCPVGC